MTLGAQGYVLNGVKIDAGTGPELESDPESQLHFTVDLIDAEASSLKITASKKSENLKQVFVLDSSQRTAKLEFD